MCVCLSVCLPVGLSVSVCVSVCECVCLSVCLSVKSSHLYLYSAFNNTNCNKALHNNKIGKLCQ